MRATVSCVVPVHDGERHLGETLQSILAQTHPPLEIIVVDDGSLDGSAALARSFGPPVSVIAQEQSGPPSARNRGIRAARGDFLALCDADDLFAPDKLARQVACFAARPALDICLSTAENFWEPGLEAERARYEAVGRTRATHHLGTMLARRSVFDRIGLLDETGPAIDHIEWFARVADAGLGVEILPEVLMHRRMHAASMSHTAASAEPYLDFLRARISARRER
jgi:glycosyltransferase involved in cell wall biosynthesis